MTFVQSMLKIGTICLSFLSAFNLQAFHLIELKSGGELQGEIVLERPEAYYVDLGFDVLQVPKSAVKSTAKIDTSSGLVEPRESAEQLYRTGSDVKDRSIRDWVEQIGEAVALVQTPTGLGSGFVVHEDGYIVTNDHVVAGEHRISVTVFEKGSRGMKRQTYDNVSIVAISADLDLALLRIEESGLEPFKTVPIAAADDALREGQTVFAIGSPLGLDRTVSEGIISVANRVIGGRLYLQTTTQINPGNSGGPLFNLRGEVVGVNNMKIAAVGAEGLGFSISSRVLKSFLDNRDAYAFDPRNPNAGFRYMSPPKSAK
ncbi:MAG: S1C family serine protease [Coraliomargarita sp.]